MADTLRALDVDARVLKAQAESEAIARETLDLTHKEFTIGAANYLSLLNAERQYQQARINLVQSQALRYADTAALFQALGGGWWNRSNESAAEGRNGSNLTEPPSPAKAGEGGEPSALRAIPFTRGEGK